MSARAAATFTPVERLEAKALVYLALARHFATPDARPADGLTLEELGAALDRLGWANAAEAARAALTKRDEPDVRLQHSQIFYQSVPPPYETSHAGGGAADLADIAGFYRAFGVTLAGDKPDHLVAELEFVALLLAKEAHARSRGDDRADICASARARFLRERLGTWTDAFADAVETRHPGAVWSHLARAVARCVTADAREIGVEPLARRLPPGMTAWPSSMPGPQIDLDRPPCADGEVET
ncbi:MAG TPA: molecular chaperone TorD family protein [Dehalococcoidia bacterium]|nr:molecular chaperone TorD family protein [Dehalococcoidia bacterium]